MNQLWHNQYSRHATSFAGAWLCLERAVAQHLMATCDVMAFAQTSISAVYTIPPGRNL